MPRALPPIEGKSGTTISPSLVESVAGFSAGVVSCLAAHPLDLLKNRLQREWHLYYSLVSSRMRREGESISKKMESQSFKGSNNMEMV